MTSRDDGLRVTIVALAAALLTVQVSWVASPAEAAFPGDNGLIAFVSNTTTGTGVNNPTGDSEIFVAPPVGDVTQLTHNTSDDGAPS